MIVFITICFFLYGGLGTVAYMYANRKKRLFWSDIASPIFVVVLWVFITASGYGPQSLSHIIEVPFALLSSLVLLNLRVFVVDRYYEKYRFNSYAGLALSLFIVFLLRTFMPYLPE
ncbi:MAG TPA: hypothetical protein VGB26_12465 [Nitrospiria bacterium]|jgi:hypothetical protein